MASPPQESSSPAQPEPSETMAFASPEPPSAAQPDSSQTMASSPSEPTSPAQPDSLETPSPPSRAQPNPSASTITITVAHHGTPHAFHLPGTSTLIDLATTISNTLALPAPSLKLLIPKHGLLKTPFPPTPLSLLPRKIQLLASTPAEIASLAAPTRRPSPIKPATPARTHDVRKAHDRLTYTFHTLVPLPHLPQPGRSLRFLERLRDDAGIRAAMAAHRFSVPVLAEMDPAAHTTHESRTLGLNRNRGAAIELRLRTDAYDGYRDYRTIRKTLCHELAHNVFGEHDRDFWDLCGRIEKEVERADWTRGGRSVGEEEFYNPRDGGVGEVDGGGWRGGEFVLGGVGEGREGGSRREVMAKAAEERMKRRGDGGGGGGR